VASAWLGFDLVAGTAPLSVVDRLGLVPWPDEPGWLTVLGRSESGTWIGASARRPAAARSTPTGSPACEGSARPDAVAVVGEAPGCVAAGRVGDGSGPDGRRGVVGREGAGTDGRVGDMGRGGAGAVPAGATFSFSAGVAIAAFSEVTTPEAAVSKVEPELAATSAGEGAADASVPAGCVLGGGSSASRRAPTGAPAAAAWASVGRAVSPDFAAAAASTRAASDPVAWVGAVAALVTVPPGAGGRIAPPPEELREPAVDEAAVDAAAMGESAVGEPAGGKPTADTTAVGEPAVDATAAGEPAGDAAAVDEPAVDTAAGDGVAAGWA
jgi:hypothetical protein